MTRTKSHLAWLIWGLAAAYFFSDYFARVSPGVMGRELQLAFSVGTAELGLLSSFFYYPYIAMQIPVGLLVDRYSIRFLLTIMAILTALGCVVFGISSSLWVAIIGRMLIGFSAAFAFVSALRLAAMWFPPSKLGLLAGLTQALGMWGAAVGEAPVSLLMSALGWRHTMLVMALVFGLLAILIYAFVQDRPSHKQFREKKAEKKQRKVVESLRIILSNRQTWYVALFVGFLFAPIAILGEFWGPSYLQYGRGLSAHSAAFADGLIFIGWGFGGPLAGYLSDRFGMRRPFMLFSAISGFVVLSLILFCPGLALWQLNSLFFLLGLTNAGLAVAYAVATEINCRGVIGISIAFANMSSVIIGALLQPVFGKILEWTVGHGVTDIATLTTNDFHYAVLLLPVCSLFAIFMTFFIKETHCRPTA
jgi:sugar phosphate permease